MRSKRKPPSRDAFARRAKAQDWTNQRTAATRPADVMIVLAGDATGSATSTRTTRRHHTMTTHRSNHALHRTADNMKHAEGDETPKHLSQNRESAESKQRRSRTKCPICLVGFEKNAKRTRRVSMCISCQAHPSIGKRCSRCNAEAIWENKASAACQSCGAHGKKDAVIVAQA